MVPERRRSGIGSFKLEIKGSFLLVSWLCALVSLCLLAGCASGGGKGAPGTIQDEAMKAGRQPNSFAFADEDFFHDMDQTKNGILSLAKDEIQGRNMWMVWTGGDDRLWDVLNWKSLGTFDMLRIVSSYKSPSIKYKFARSNRWQYLGLVNEPCFAEASEPDPSRYNLWLDKRIPGCDPRFNGEDPFADESKYPGVMAGHRGETLPDGTKLPVGSFYGYPSGIVGLRLFPNPDFGPAEKAKWDAKRYYENDPTYVTKDLVRPYRVGMACAFCHVGPNPLKPPADPNSPKWENLSSNVGAQYFWFNRIFAWEADKQSFLFQALSTYRPGALDTSLVSTDYIDNPRTMNAVYYLGPRLVQAQRWGHERLAGGGINNKQFTDFPALRTGPLAVFYEPPDNVLNPRVLKDGSDSVGVLGALNRVYLNIGLYSEEWLTHFNALFGGQKTSPIEILTARRDSTYWNVTEAWTPGMAKFFLASTEPHHLSDAPGGAVYLTASTEVLDRGKVVFAERCARCHSSKLPAPAAGLDPLGCSGKDYLQCWQRYWEWTKTDGPDGDTTAFKPQMRKIVRDSQFLDNNYLSSETRIPVTLLQTNSCSPLASNAIGGSIWDNFSSQTYKDLPSVGEITYYHPVTGAPLKFTMPAGGRGYTRPASLVSVWSTAPYLLNNSAGTPKEQFNADPSVASRMHEFDIAIRQMLWPETRATDPIIGPKVPGPSLIDRTDSVSYIKVPQGFVSPPVRDLLKIAELLLPMTKGPDGDVQIGPIPQGTPIGLLANLDLDPGEKLSFAERLRRDKTIVGLLNSGLADLKRGGNFDNLVDPLLKLSKCPDLIVNRGHYFGTSMLDPAEGEPGLSDADKNALIEFLKTF
jgi:hypothetical protein